MFMFIIDQNIIAPAIAGAARLTSAKATLPVLEGIMLEAKNGKVTVKATNLEASVEIRVEPSQVEGEGKALVPGKMLNNLCSKMSGELKFEFEDNKLKIKSPNSRAKTVTFDSNNIPELGYPQGDNKLILKSSELKNIFEKTLLSTYEGVHFNLKEDLISISGTDTYRISLLNVFYPNCGTGHFYVPSNHIEKLCPLLSNGEEEIEINWEENKLIAYKTSQLTFIGRCVAVKLLDCESIVNSMNESSSSLEIEKEPFLKAMERIVLYSNGSTAPHPVAIERDKETLKMEIQNMQVGSLEEALSCKGEGEFKANYNPLYLLEGTKPIDTDKVTLKTEKNGFLKIVSENYLVMIAPIRAVK